MKFIYITCNVSMLEIVTEMLDEMEMNDYQVIERVTAKSRFDVPRLNTGVWPGYNSSVLIQEPDMEKVTSLIEKIDTMNEQAFNNGELLTAYVWNVESYTKLKTDRTIFLHKQ